MNLRGTRIGIIGVLLIALLATGFAAGCGDDSTTDTTASPASGTTTGDGEPIVIGAALGLVGDAAPGDVPLGDAMKYAVDELNKKGGVDGRPLELIIKDMKSDPALGATVATELLDAGATIIVGPAFPGMGAGVVQTAAKQDVPVLAGTSTQPEYTVVGGATAYLVAFGDNVQAAAAAEYAAKQGYKTVYTLASPDLSYTARLPEFFLEAFEKAGGTSVGNDTFSIGQQDFAPQVTKIAALDPAPDVVYTGMFPPDTGVFLKQLRAAGVESVLIGADGLDQQALVDFAGKDAEGVVFSTHGYPSEGSEFKTFVDGMTAAGMAPDAPALASLGGDTIAVIVAAIEKAGSTDPKAVGEALAELEGVAVVNGTITYAGTSGVPLKDVALVKIEGGEFLLEDSFIPSFIPEP